MTNFVFSGIQTQQQQQRPFYGPLSGTILISARWSVTSFSFLTGQVSLPCSILHRTQLLYSLPLLINDISLLVSNGTNCLNLFHPVGM